MQVILNGVVPIGASGHQSPRTISGVLGCRAVFRYIFDTAKEWDEKAGNGECQLTLEERWSELPTCRNDHEFEFVAGFFLVIVGDCLSLPC